MTNDESSAERNLAAIEAWLEIRKLEGQRIDPANVEMHWHWTEITDPYGVYGPCPKNSCIGRTYFFRTPGSEIWVASTDIPEEKMEILWARINNSDLTENDVLQFLFD